MKTAIITGITGQDGFYLSSYLLSIGYRVIGIIRRSSTNNTCRLLPLLNHNNLHLVSGDVLDQASIERVLLEYAPDEFYHLAAQSHVAESFYIPHATAQITGIGTLNCLEAIRNVDRNIRFYFAGSSEQFGNYLTDSGETVLNEESPMHPRSPYAAAKVFGYNVTRNYRQAYDMFASVGILMNHESPLRGENFVTKKITKSVALLKHCKIDEVSFGNLDSKRDWGFAGDYVVAMHKILNHNEPDDFVIGTGQAYSPREFLLRSAEVAGLENVSNYVKTDPNLIRPTEVDCLIADSSKAKSLLDWEPELSFDDLVKVMTQYDLAYYSSMLDEIDLRQLLGDALIEEVKA